MLLAEVGDWKAAGREPDQDGEVPIFTISGREWIHPPTWSVEAWPGVDR
ncbi:hypothetical protein ABT297_04600 [Dactylosporangium sp. NPDC000555]